jgi:hypothetical protein
LAITIAPVKTHNGRYGTTITTIRVDPREDGPARYLADICLAAGGTAVVAVPSTNVLRKALGRLGRKALPGVSGALTGYVYRQQALADLKATTGAGRTVAEAAGHCTDRTQAHYGRAEHGRRRGGFLSATSARQARTGSVERAEALGAKRKRERPVTAKPSPTSSVDAMGPELKPKLAREGEKRVLLKEPTLGGDGLDRRRETDRLHTRSMIVSGRLPPTLQDAGGRLRLGPDRGLRVHDPGPDVAPNFHPAMGGSGLHLAASQKLNQFK